MTISQLLQLSACELDMYIDGVGKSLMIDTTAAEKQIISVLIRKFLARVEQFKGLTKYDNYHPLINFADQITMKTLKMYKTRWLQLPPPNVPAIISNFPVVNDSGFLVYPREEE